MFLWWAALHLFTSLACYARQGCPGLGGRKWWGGLWMVVYFVFEAVEGWGVDHSWWRRQIESLSALLALCVGNSPVTGEFPSQRPVKRSFDVSLICALNKRLSKQWWGWWFETLSRSLWRHCNGMHLHQCQYVRICIWLYQWLVASSIMSNQSDRMARTWDSYQIRKIAGCACIGMPGTFSPPLTSKETAS